MKRVFKHLWMFGLTLTLFGCLEVTPNISTIILSNGETQIFTAVSDIQDAEVVWNLDGQEVARGNYYAFLAEGDCSQENIHKLVVTEQGGSGLRRHDTVTWTISIGIDCLLPCYLDEDGDQYGCPDKMIITEDPPANCVEDNGDCDDGNPDIYPGAIEIIDGLDNNCNGVVDESIVLQVYSNGWGALLDTIEMEEEGSVTITVEEEQPYSGDTPAYFIYVLRSGYFTKYYYCAYGDTIVVDLDPIDAQMFNGVMFLTQSYFGPTYLANTTVDLYRNGVLVMDFTTDNEGRFSIDVAPGTYTARFRGLDGHSYEEPFAVQGLYADFRISAYAQADKPNIYIYPEQTMALSVNIAFPNNGYVSQSIPEYGSGWQITADPSGLIDGRYTYLFYESVQPDLCQYARGWVVETATLSDFFQSNMARTGFNQKEIDDFVDYWIPRLNDDPFYAIYPQYNSDMDKMTHLEFSVQPTSLLRLIYAVKGVEDNRLNILEPEIPDFSRQGFTVVEWGVILR